MACGTCKLLDLFGRLCADVQVEGSKLLNIPLIVTEQVDRILLFIVASECECDMC